MLVLGIDPGERILGWCLASFRGSKRQIIDGGDVREAEEHYLDWLLGLLASQPIEVVGIEDYGWMGEEKSANPQAFSISKLVGRMEGAIRMWAKLHRPTLVVLLIPKQGCNSSVGITGRRHAGQTAKSRVTAAITRLFPTVQFANEHQRDAAAACVAARARAGRIR